MVNSPNIAASAKRDSSSKPETDLSHLERDQDCMAEGVGALNEELQNSFASSSVILYCHLTTERQPFSIATGITGDKDINCYDAFEQVLTVVKKTGQNLRELKLSRKEDKPEDLTRKDEMDWITKNSDAIAYIKLSLADEQALQFAAEDNAKVLWDKIRATYMGEGEDRKN
ncbi:retrovirus-related Pol polyprotein from transposon TNT 1-94 [Trichonephila clavipes]|nr:retrovirus-related Pol polyprotein from transposon TNT 1-94 [Trichonephila clavipes]